MQAEIQYKDKKYTIDLSRPLDISIPISGDENLTAWQMGQPEISPVVIGDFIGRVSAGSSVNFNNIFFNPHAHGTHTECIGHITKEFHSVNQSFDKYFFYSQLISVVPEEKDGDLIITKAQVADLLLDDVEAVIIRTLPNMQEKKSKQYSGTNPIYMEATCAEMLRDKGVKHLLVDIPSVDKEDDRGALAAHKAFWDFDGNQRLDATITEFIYVADEITDGNYFLNLQIAAFENDASPSRPVLYGVSG